MRQARRHGGRSVGHGKGFLRQEHTLEPALQHGGFKAFGMKVHQVDVVAGSPGRLNNTIPQGCPETLRHRMAVDDEELHGDVATQIIGWTMSAEQNTW